MNAAPNEQSTTAAISSESPNRPIGCLAIKTARRSLFWRSPSVIFEYIEGYYNNQRLHSALGCHKAEKSDQPLDTFIHFAFKVLLKK